MKNEDDFFEEDEPVEKVLRAFENGVKGVTAPPVASFTFTFVLPKDTRHTYQVGAWVTSDAPVQFETPSYVG
jgi:hypothetical protein